MGDWWQGLSGLNQAFYAAAAFFSAFFVWQFIAALMGLGGEGDVDVDADVDVDVDAAGDATYDDFDHGAAADAAESVASFKLVSIRSIIAFFTLFSWAGALYMDRDFGPTASLLYAIVWGVIAMVVVALIFHMMRKLTETGTPRLATCIGKSGTVYLDIPDGGRGEIRIPVSGVMAHVKARTADGKALKMGTPVRARRVLDSATVEIESISSDKSNSDT